MTKLFKTIVALLLCIIAACVAVTVWHLLPEKSTAPTEEIDPDAPDPLAATYEAALALLEEGNITEARQEFTAIVAKAPHSPQATEALVRLGGLNAAELLSPQPNDTLKQTYTVAAGDSISRIAARNGVTMEAIMLVNNLSSPNIRAGQELLIPIFHASAEINTAKKNVTLRNNGEFFRAYPIVEIAGTMPVPAGDSLSAAEIKVSERIAFAADGGRVPFGEKAFPDTTRHITLTPANILIRTALAGGETPAPSRRPPVATLYLAPEDINELYMLVPTGTVFTITK